MTKLPLSQIVGQTFKGIMVCGFDPNSRTFTLAGRYPHYPNLTDCWATHSLDDLGIEPEFTKEELDKMEQLRSTNQIAQKSLELKGAIEKWFSSPGLR